MQRLILEARVESEEQRPAEIREEDKWGGHLADFPVRPSGSLYFFFSKQETTCLKSSTWPQPVCFYFHRVRSYFSQQTCHCASRTQQYEILNVQEKKVLRVAKIVDYRES